MHPHTEQLLSIRDVEPVDSTVLEHVGSCRECSAAVAGLQRVRGQLGALPPVEAMPGAWASVQARLAAHERSARRRVLASRMVAAACVASIALFATLYRDAGTGTSDVSRPLATARAPDGTAVEALLDRSLELEQALAAMPARPAVERAETSLPIDALQAHVQWIDHQLSQADADGAPAEDAERLWRERVDVMNSLVRLRYVEAQRLAL